MMNLGHFHPQSSPSSLTLSPGTLLNMPPLCSCLPFAHSLQSLVTWQTVGGRLLGSKHRLLWLYRWRKSRFLSPARTDRSSPSEGMVPRAPPRPWWMSRGPSAALVACTGFPSDWALQPLLFKKDWRLAYLQTWRGHLLLLFGKRLLKLQEVCQECLKSYIDQGNVILKMTATHVLRLGLGTRDTYPCCYVALLSVDPGRESIFTMFMNIKPNLFLFYYCFLLFYYSLIT